MTSNTNTFSMTKPLNLINENDEEEHETSIQKENSELRQFRKDPQSQSKEDQIEETKQILGGKHKEAPSPLLRKNERKKKVMEDMFKTSGVFSERK